MKTVARARARRAKGRGRWPRVTGIRKTAVPRDGSARRLHSRQLASGKVRREASSIVPREMVLERQPADAQHVTALKNFETAARYFQKQSYEKAAEIFEKLASTAPAGIADRARVHLRLCQQRLGATAPAPKSAADYHVLGVSALNAGSLETAVTCLSKAQKLEPNREEIRYALAAAYALRGNADAALEQLKVAISLRPQNRFQARRDQDFQSLSADPRFQCLIYERVSEASRLPS